MSTTRNPLAIGAITLSVLAIASTASAQSVEIENFIGTVDIREGATLSIDGDARGTAELRGSRLRVDGGESVKGLSCNTKRNGDVMIGKGWRSKSAKSLTRDYPTLSISAPASTAIVIRDSIVFGEVRNVGEVEASLPSCGKLVFGDVAGGFSVGLSGSADVDAGSVGEADLRTSGSGDFEVVNADSLSFKSSGSGDLVMRAVSGPASVSTSGSGDAVIASVGGGLNFRSTGSGDIVVGHVDGPVEISTTGSGDVEIDRGEVTTLSVRTTGSGDVSIEGSVGDAEISSTGSGDVDIREQTGRLSARASGSGDVTVNGRRGKSDTLTFD